MKKSIFIWILTVFAFWVICFVFYFLVYNAETKQTPKEKSFEEILEESKQFSIAYRKNLEQKILFYKKYSDSAETLEKLYLERGKLYREHRKYKTAFECFQNALKSAQKNNNENNIARAAWNMIWLASLQNQTDLVLDLNNKFENIIKSKFGKIFIAPDSYYYWVGNAYLKKNNLEKASEYLTPGIKIANKIYTRVAAHNALLMCAFSILKAQKQDFQDALKYLNKVADNFFDFKFDYKYNYKEKKRFLEALAVLEKCNPPFSLELSSFYKKVAGKYIDGENKIKFKKYIFKAIKVLEGLKAKKEKIADLYYELGVYERYVPNKYFNKCINILQDAKGKDAAGIVYKVAYAGYDKSSEESLRLLLCSLKMLPESGEKPLWVIRAYQLIAYCYNEKKEWQKSAEYSKKCLALVNKEPKLTKASLASDCYSFLDDFYKNQGDLKKRIKNAEDAVNFMLDIKAEFIMLNAAYEELSKIYKSAKRYSDAEKCCWKIISVFEKNPKLIENTEYLKQKINAYCEIGDICLHQDAKEKALAVFDQAGKLITKKVVPEISIWDKIRALTDIADGYYYLEKDVLAEKYYKKVIALVLIQKNKDHRTLSYLYYRIGNIFFAQKKWLKAKDYFEKSWENVSDKEIDIDSIILLANKLSVCYHQTDEIKKALRFSLLAYKEQKKKYGSNLQTGIYAFIVGAAYDKLDDKNNALKYIKLAHEIFLKYQKEKPELVSKTVKYIKEINQRK